MDWARYTGITRRTVRKRSAEEMVAAAERAALAAMLGHHVPQRVTEAEPAPAVEEASAPPAVPAPPAPPSYGWNMGLGNRPPIPDPSTDVALPKPVVGMRVRWLRPTAPLHRCDGEVIATDGRDGECTVRWLGAVNLDIRVDRVEWLTKCFPTDGSVLPRVGMDVTIVPHDGADPIATTIDTHDPLDNSWWVKIGGGGRMGFVERNWLVDVWPRGMAVAK